MPLGSWDRRQGDAEVLSQLSRELFGEWQAERYTLSYGTSDYPRVEARVPAVDAALAARCREDAPGPAQSGVTVTFSQPLALDGSSWRCPARAAVAGPAFEAIGGSRAMTCPGRAVDRSAPTSRCVRVAGSG